MVRLTNIPLIIGWMSLAIGTVVLGFGPRVLFYGAGVYLIALLGLFIWWYGQPVFDRAAPAPVMWGCLGWVSTLCLVYLFIRLWLLNPKELLFLHSIPWLGSSLLVFFIYFVPVMFQAVVQAWFVKLFRST